MKKVNKKVNKKINNVEFTTTKKDTNTKKAFDYKRDTSVRSYKLLRIVLDTSGSVNKFLGPMVELIKESLKILKNSLGCKILVSISVFSTEHRVILPFTDINNVNINTIPFPTNASGYTRTGQALLETLQEIMPYYENLKELHKQPDGIEVYPPVTLLITDGMTYGGSSIEDQQENLKKYNEAAKLIKSYEHLPPDGIDKLMLFCCGLSGMLGSASLVELQNLSSYHDRIFTANNKDFLKKQLDKVMYYTLTYTITVF